MKVTPIPATVIVRPKLMLFIYFPLSFPRKRESSHLTPCIPLSFKGEGEVREEELRPS